MSVEFVGQIPAVNRPNRAVNPIFFRGRLPGETLTTKKHLFLALILAVAGGTMAQTPPNYHLLKKTVVGGEGGWDYLLADPMGGHLYLSHSTQQV